MARCVTPYKLKNKPEKCIENRSEHCVHAIGSNHWHQSPIHHDKCCFCGADWHVVIEDSELEMPVKHGKYL